MFNYSKNSVAVTVVVLMFSKPWQRSKRPLIKNGRENATGGAENVGLTGKIRRSEQKNCPVKVLESERKVLVQSKNHNS